MKSSLHHDQNHADMQNTLAGLPANGQSAPNSAFLRECRATPRKSVVHESDEIRGRTELHINSGGPIDGVGLNARSQMSGMQSTRTVHASHKSLSILQKTESAWDAHREQV